MPAVILVGAQWGDEGKGKITDYLADEADCIVRYQGGSNAGHTVELTMRNSCCTLFRQGYCILRRYA